MNRVRCWAGLAVLAAAGLTILAHAADNKPNSEFASKATWKVPSAESVRSQALAWLATSPVDAASRGKLESLWATAVKQGHEDHLLEVVAATLVAGDPRASQVVAVTTLPRRQIALPDVAWLSDEAVPAFERHNLRLLYGRWLVQELLYDEAMAQLADLQPADVVDPAGLLFLQAVVQHHALSREPGLQTISRLLEQDAAIAKRYTSVARLMQADLELLEDESLDHIARRMDDIRRRLDLGRAGPKVREVEDGVTASLDKLIKETERKQQEKQHKASKAAKEAKEKMKKKGKDGKDKDGKDRKNKDGDPELDPLRPLDETKAMPGKGPGEVDEKDIGQESGWGDLPERERDKALQQIGQDFPAHYRDMIEQYFRKLATQDEQEPDK